MEPGSTNNPPTLHLFCCKLGKMNLLSTTYRPAISPKALENAVGRLLVPGHLDDRELVRRIDRIGERFGAYAATYPYGLWAPGLCITQPMRAMTELYLPMSEIRRALQRLYAASLIQAPAGASPPLHGWASWLDLAESLQPLVSQADPAALLRSAMADAELRIRLLFALSLPKRYGGGFDRYPGQSAYLREWLAHNMQRFPGGISCLDAACGSGEGTYELAMLLTESGLGPREMRVYGATLEPLELFAAAHAWFPHDPVRQAAYRQRIGHLFESGIAARIRFLAEDIVRPGNGGRYEVILCNGLLGGPMFNDRRALARTILQLSERLSEGGVLLAADRFHAGWKARIPHALLAEFMAGAGLAVLEVAEGVAGTRTGSVSPPTRGRRRSPSSGPAPPA